MQTALNFSQTVFYLTVSIAIITLGVMIAILTYHLMRIVKELEKMSANLGNASVEVIEKINEIIERLSSLPVLSFFLGRGTSKPKVKGRDKR